MLVLTKIERASNWTEHTGRVEISEDEQVDRAPTSSSSIPSESEEMIPSNPAEDANQSALYARKLQDMTDSNDVFQMQHAPTNDKMSADDVAAKNVKSPQNDITSKNANVTENAQSVFYALEVPILPTIEKGKEKRWSQMSLDEKYKFDLSMAKELSNLLSSKALRSLTSQEWDDLDYSRVASMRLVLTP